MKPSEAQILRLGQRVEWATGQRGTVREVSNVGIKIEFDNGMWRYLVFADSKMPFHLLRKLRGSFLLS